jgi:ABC-type nitrate/sulfonate/bicarbonate transport system permease component
MYRPIHLTYGLILVLLLAAGCGDDTTTSTTPTTPTPVTVVETFSGTLNRNGGVTHTFATGASGTVTATLTAVSPDSALVLGLSLGTWNGVACQVVLASDKAVQGAVVTGVVSSTGNLCVRLYDVGNIVGTTTYEVQVVHP